MRWIKSVALSLVVVLAVTVPMLFGAEYLARSVIGLGEPIIYEPSVVWGYAPRPDQQVTRRRGATVTINDAGLRATIPWDGEAREKILFLGDSVTFGGTYMDDAALFSSLVCENLPCYACYNGGVNAYGVMNMVARSRFDDRLDGASMVVFLVVAEDFQRGLRNARFAHFMMRSPNPVFPALHEILAYAAARFDPKIPLAKRRDAITPKDRDAYRRQARKVVDWTMELLAGEVARLRSRGTRVLVLYSPDRYSVMVKHRMGPVAHIFDAAARNGVDLIDLTVPLRASGIPMERLFVDQVHYEAAAHRVVATFLTDILSRDP